jgi:DNA-binding transcriptional ArsR family regulator
MNDIQAYILARYGEKLFPNWNDRDTCFYLTRKLEIPINETALQRLLEFPPKAKHLVKALSDMGLTQAKICQLTGLTQSTVSYHLNSATKKPYVNPFLQALRNEKSRQELQNAPY